MPPDLPPDPAITNEVADLVVRLTDEKATRAERRSLLLRLTAAIARTGVRSGRVGGRWLVETVLDLAPRIPVRDLATLQAHHPGLVGEALADAVVSSAAKATAGIGAVGGAVAAAEYAAPPTLLGAPVQLAAETLAIVAVELKLVAELHAVYGVSIPGTPRQRATAYAVAWTRGSAAERFGPGALTGAVRRQLQTRIMRRLGRTTFTMAPFLAGAAAGAILNHRGTRKVGDKVRAALRRDGHRATAEKVPRVIDA